MDLGISANVAPLLAEVKHFIEEEILPVEHDYYSDIAVGDRWTFTDRQTEIREGLKEQGKSQGLVEFFPHRRGGRFRAEYSGVRLPCRGNGQVAYGS